MEALVRTGTGDDDIELQDVPEPSPGPGEVKLEIKAVGICGTDVHGHPNFVPPQIIGHELSGQVIEVGTGVKHRKVGDRVTSETTASICGKCKFCATEDYNLCISRRGISTKAPGAFARYFVIREQSTHVLPDDVGYSAGSLCEPLACAVHAVIEQAEVAEGEVVAITGPGPLGLLVMQAAKSVGATVIIAGLTQDADRLALADELGAERTVDILKEDLQEVVKSMTGGYGADVVFECSGSPKAVPGALACVRVRGKYVQGGILHAPVSLDFDDVFFNREVVMYGSHTQKPSSWRTSLQLLREGKVDLQPLVSDELPLSEWQEGFDRMRSGKVIKIILKP